jgi:hypothetical protein
MQKRADRIFARPATVKWANDEAVRRRREDDSAPCSLGLSATSQQYFSLTTNQPPATSQQYSSLRTNQHQSSATSQPNRLLNSGA